MILFGEIMPEQKNKPYGPNIQELETLQKFGDIHNVGGEGALWKGPGGDYIRSCMPIPGYKPIGNKTEIELKKE